MKNVYILDEAFSSKRNGIGTYIKQLIACFRPVANVCVVSFNDNVDEFSITIEKGIKRMLFPTFHSGNFISHGEIISLFFKLYIPDIEDNLFIINHSPCSTFLSSIKETLPLSKIVFVIHDFNWIMDCEGNDLFYRKIIKSKNLKTIKKKYPHLLRCYEEEKKIYDFSDKVICLCEDTKCLLLDLYKISESKIFMIPNGISDISLAGDDKNDIRNKLLINENEKILLFVGRLVRSKGTDVLMKAFEKILEYDRNVRLVIVGSSYGGYLEKLFSEHPFIISHVTFTSYLDKEILHKWYSIADIGILPSYYEQCSCTGIEMLMYGLPIVTTAGFGLRNMFHQGTNALVVPIGDRKNSQEFAVNIANSVIELLKSKTLCENLSVKARCCYESKYDIRHMREGYRMLMSKLI